MNIGQAAQQTGVSAKMIRHYEAIGLLRPAARRANDYRHYQQRDIHDLKFIRRARKLGFSMEEIGSLLALWRDERRSSSEVRRIATAHVAGLEARVAEAQAMIATLRTLIDACPGDATPDCPILADLGENCHISTTEPVRIDREKMIEGVNSVQDAFE
jgi:Cu(I)-responsive transcriptional regulator